MYVDQGFCVEKPTHDGHGSRYGGHGDACGDGTGHGNAADHAQGEQKVPKERFQKQQLLGLSGQSGFMGGGRSQASMAMPPILNRNQASSMTGKMAAKGLD